MECQKRWQAVTPGEVKQECLYLSMKLADVDQITELVTRRQRGRTFNISKSSYKGFNFNSDM